MTEDRRAAAEHIINELKATIAGNVAIISDSRGPSAHFADGAEYLSRYFSSLNEDYADYCFSELADRSNGDNNRSLKYRIYCGFRRHHLFPSIDFHRCKQARSYEGAVNIR